MLRPSIDAARSRNRFWAKAGIALSLIALADRIAFGYAGGAVLGGFGLVWLASLVALRPQIARSRGGPVAIGAGTVFASALIYDPGLLAAVLFLIAIASAALVVRHRFDHAGWWFVRIASLGVWAPLRMLSDLSAVLRLSSRGGISLPDVFVRAILPVVGGGAFLALFATANPILGNAFAATRLPDLSWLLLHSCFWAVAAALLWPTFRPRALRILSDRPPLMVVPDQSAAALLPALVVFNAVFAIENGLDLAFLWSGAELPAGVTLAEYAHRGAYTLIATAVLAGLFVLVALRPGSRASRNPWVRRLVLIWVGQNILLVASSMRRLAEYIAAYSLTELRIAALVWMGLVALGLALTCWRFLAGRTAGWLINANALATALVLAVACFVDFGTLAANWNVRHLRDPGAIDLCYLERQGSSALVPLIALRAATNDEGVRDRADYLVRTARERLRERQADWRGWHVRGALRLAEADRLLAGDEQPVRPAPYGRRCGGEILPPPPAPLTPVQKP